MTKAGKRLTYAAAKARIALDGIGVFAEIARRRTERLGEVLHRFRDMDEEKASKGL